MALCFDNDTGKVYHGEPGGWVQPVQPDWLRDGQVIENVGLYRSTVRPSIDFETYSPAGYFVHPQTKKITAMGSKGGLMAVGTPVYAEDPDTEVLCLFYDLKDGNGRRGWWPGLPLPSDLLQHVARGGDLEAFNVTFEWWIWNLVCVAKYGFPQLVLTQCHCVMARSRRYSLPGGLDNCAKVLGLPQKDPDGKRLLQKLSRPHTPTKRRPEIRWTPATAWDDFISLYRYCDQDVYSEDCCAAHIPDLTETEHETWLMDQTINARGVQVDIESLDACIALMNEMFNQLTLELAQITNGAVGSASERDKLIAWLSTHNLHLPDLKAPTVEKVLSDGTTAFYGKDVHRVLEIRQILAGANIKKLPTIKMQVNSDGRLRDQYRYCGADRTGRSGTQGVQLQNLTSKGPKSKTCNHCGRIVGINCQAGVMRGCPECGHNEFTENSDWTIEAVECALYDIKHYDYHTVTEIWGPVSKLLAGCLRGLLTAAEGKRLVCVDFSAIEAVVAACLSRCQWRIDVFATHGKIYEMSASSITQTPMEVYERYRQENGFDHPDRKLIGKIAELASAYGGWINSWKNFGAEMDDATIKKHVLAWRAASPEIVEMWGDQYRETVPGSWEFVPCLFGLEGMAILAILNPGNWYAYNDISYVVHQDILFCRLPSGRLLHYHRPRLSDSTHKLAKLPCYQITFEGWNSNPDKGPMGWVRMETYGGRLFENVVQATAADLQFEALKRCEKANYPIVMHTHDEGCAELPILHGSIEEMAQIMCQRPEWASWWPIKAAGWEHKRYQKD